MHVINYGNALAKIQIWFIISHQKKKKIEQTEDIAFSTTFLQSKSYFMVYFGGVIRRKYDFFPH